MPRRKPRCGGARANAESLSVRLGRLPLMRVVALNAACAACLFLILATWPVPKSKRSWLRLPPILKDWGADAGMCFIKWARVSTDGTCSLARGIGCNPYGPAPCCSANSFCGSSPDHCESSRGGVDFRRYQTAGEIPRAYISNFEKIKGTLPRVDYRDRIRLDAHAITDEWFGSTGSIPGAKDAKDAYVFRNHVSDAFNRYDSSLYRIPA